MNPLLPLWILLADVVVLLIGWLVQRRLRNAGLADLLWACCICASAIYYGIVARGSPTAQLLVATMGGLWAFRLIMHLLRRVLVEREDARYLRMRETWPNPERRFFALFLWRGVSAGLYSLPLYVAASNPLTDSGIWTLLAAIVYLIGLSGEAYADLQLSTFRANPRHFGHTYRRGLWRYSRHPNYFFSAVHWCSYVLLAVGMPWPLWSLTLIGPVLTMLGWVVSIPLAEAQALRMRGQDYRDYRAATSILLPWFPRGWPKDQPDTASWQTPLPPSRRVVRTASPVPLEAYVRREAKPPNGDAA